MNINALKTREENYALETGQTVLSEHTDSTDGTDDDHHKDKDCHCVQNCKKY